MNRHHNTSDTCRQRHWRDALSIAALCLVAGAPLAWADDASRVVIRPLDAWSGVFADSRVTFRFSAKSDVQRTERLAWSLSAKGRTVTRGEVAMELTEGKTTLLALPVRMPHVREGVILKTTLSVSVVGNDDSSASDVEQTIWIFPQDAFSDRQQWLTKLQIQLYDPEEKTGTVLEEAGIPFETLQTLASLKTVDSGMVLIGSGISLKDYPKLGSIMAQLATLGVPVLCLTPADGVVPIPIGVLGNEHPVREPEQEVVRPQSVMFRQRDIARQLDKRLDANAWFGGGSIKQGFRFASVDERVVMESVSTGQGWPWIEVYYPNDRGRLILCGFGIVEQWNDSPVPRYLLLRILQRMSDKTSPANINTQTEEK